MEFIYYQATIFALLILLPLLDVFMNRKRYGIELKNSMLDLSVRTLLGVSMLSSNFYQSNASNVRVWCIYIPLFLGLCILYRIYYKSIYKISGVEGFDLESGLKRAIASSGLSLGPIESDEGNGWDTYPIKGSKTRLVLEKNKYLFSRQPYYTLTFKGLGSHMGRQSILDYLSEDMAQRGMINKNYLSKVLEWIGILVVLVFVLALINTKVIKSLDFLPFDKGMQDPLKVIVYDADLSGPGDNFLVVEDRTTIKTFYEIYFKEKRHYNVSSRLESIRENMIYEVIMGQPSQSIILTGYGTYFYMPHESFAQLSPIRNMMVTVYSLYGKHEGNYYWFIDDGEGRAFIEGLLDDDE